MNKKNELHKKVSAWNEMNTTYLKQIKSLLTEMEGPKKFQVICYFTYSINIFHEKEKENFTIGSFHIQNVGDKPLTNPIICIKLSPQSPFEFSGKYLYPNSRQRMGMPDAWERINEATEKQEFWLKPVNKQKIEPSETISFSNFQVKWRSDESYTGSIMGFVYGDEIKEGLSSLNEINIGGVVGKENMNEQE